MTIRLSGHSQRPAPATLSFAGPAATGPASALLQVNTTQTVAPGGISLPLIVRAVDSTGVPLAQVPVQFTSDATATLSTISPTTDLLGYAQTTATIASTAVTGVVTVTATASGQSVPFTINVATTGPGGGTGGGTTPGGLQILSGQGQVTGVSFPIQQPLTVTVVDATGNPIPGVPITWTIAQGTGALGSVDAATNDKGIATASYAEFLVPFGVPYNAGCNCGEYRDGNGQFHRYDCASIAERLAGEAVLYASRSPDADHRRAGGRNCNGRNPSGRWISAWSRDP